MINRDIKRAEDYCEDEEEKASLTEWRNSPNRSPYLSSLHEKSLEETIEHLIYLLWHSEDTSGLLWQSLREGDRWRMLAKNFKGHAERFASSSKELWDLTEFENDKRKLLASEGRKKGNEVKSAKAKQRDEGLMARIREIGINKATKVILRELKKDPEGLRGLKENSFEQKVDLLLATLRDEADNDSPIS